MFSSRFFKKFLALNLVAFSAAALFSHLPFSSTNTLVDNEASLTSTGSAFGSGLDKPFAVDFVVTSYVNNNDGYIYYSGYNYVGAAGNGTSGSGTNVTSFYAMRKRNSATTSAEGTEKHLETGYFEDVRDYSASGHQTVVIDSDGAVWSAGRNDLGQLGNGGLSNSTVNGYKCYNTFQVASMTSGDATSYFTSGAVKVETSSGSTTLIQMEDGSLWAAGTKSYIGLGHLATNPNTFVETIDAYTVEAHRGIVDFAVGNTSSYVLFGDGSLWMSSETSDGEWTELASNIKMFDVDSNGYYVYTVDQENNISYMFNTNTELTYLMTPEGEEVMQVRGAGNTSSSGTNYAWGYLTTSGNLYLSSTAISPGNTATTIPSDTPTVSGVSYFDLGGNSLGIAYAYLEASKPGNMRLWGRNLYSMFGTSGSTDLAFASRTTIAINKEVNLNPGLVNTPPARQGTVKSCIFCNKKGNSHVIINLDKKLRDEESTYE